MTAELVRYDQFQFKGQVLPLIHDDRGRFVSFGRACQLLGLKQQAEWDRVQRDAAMAARTRVEYDAQDDSATYYMRVDVVPAWLFSVPTDRLPVELRRMHAAFKSELIDAVYDFTTTGVAISSRLSPLEVAERIADKILHWGGDNEHNRIIAASLLRSRAAIEIGARADGELPATVSSRIQELGKRLEPEDVQEIGRQVAAEYRRRNPGKKPGSTPVWIKGRKTPVNSYTQSDIVWIDQIINDYVRRKPLR